MTLPAEEFIRRFLLHVLPEGFHRIRHYGFLANGHRQAKLALCRRLLDAPQLYRADTPADYREQVQRLTGQSLEICPACGGPMVQTEILPGPRRGRRRTRLDSS